MGLVYIEMCGIYYILIFLLVGENAGDICMLKTRIND